MGDYKFRFGLTEFQVTLRFSNEALQLIFGERDMNLRRERERSILKVRSHHAIRVTKMIP